MLYATETEPFLTYNLDFVKRLNAELEPKGILVEGHNFHDLRLDFENGAMRARLVSSGEDIAEFQHVFFKSYFRYIEQATALGEYLRAKGISYTGQEISEYIAQTKLTQFARLALGGVPIAPTTYMSMEHYEAHFSELEATYGLPFIFKAIDGACGKDNYLISSEAEFSVAIAENPEGRFVVQPFIENDSDLRVLVIDYEVAMVIHRQRQGDTHLNNTSQGSEARLIPISELNSTHARLAIQAAKLMKRDKAGVDLMIDLSNGNPIVLEVNASPQASTGAFTEEKDEIYCKYFEKVVK